MPAPVRPPAPTPLANHTQWQVRDGQADSPQANQCCLPIYVHRNLCWSLGMKGPPSLPAAPPAPKPSAPGFPSTWEKSSCSAPTLPREGAVLGVSWVWGGDQMSLGRQTPPFITFERENKRIPGKRNVLAPQLQAYCLQVPLFLQATCLRWGKSELRKQPSRNRIIGLHGLRSCRHLSSLSFKPGLQMER